MGSGDFFAIPSVYKKSEPESSPATVYFLVLPHPRQTHIRKLTNYRAKRPFPACRLVCPKTHDDVKKMPRLYYFDSGVDVFVMVAVRNSIASAVHMPNNNSVP